MTKTILSCDFMKFVSSRLFLHYSPIPSIVWSNTNHGVLGGSNKSLMLDMLMPRGITYYSSVLYAGWSKRSLTAIAYLSVATRAWLDSLLLKNVQKELWQSTLAQHGMLYLFEDYVECSGNITLTIILIHMSTVKYCDFLFHCTWCFQLCLYSNVRKVVKTDHRFYHNGGTFC